MYHPFGSLATLHTIGYNSPYPKTPSKELSLGQEHPIRLCLRIFYFLNIKNLQSKILNIFCMPSQKNIDSLAALTNSIASAKAVIITNYAGLSVKDQTELRSKISATGASFSVAKNTLLRKVFTSRLKTLPENLDTVLNGPTAIVIAQKDAVASTKALTAFTKDHELPSIKLGLLADKILSSDEVIALSKLPSYEQLIATLMAQLNAPAQSFVSVLSASTRNLVYTLNAIAKKKGGETI